MVTPKTAAAGLGGAGIGIPISTILIWLLEMIPTHVDPYHVVVPSVVAGAFGAVISSVVAFASSYAARRSDPTPEQIADILQTHAMQTQRTTLP